MAGNNGSIRIDTKITVKGVKESLASVEQAIKNAADRISSLKKRMEELENQKTPTREYQSLDNYIRQTESSIGSLTESLRRMEGEGLQNSDAYRNISDAIGRMNADLQQSRNRMQNLVDTGRAFEFGSDSEEYKRLQKEVENEEKAMKKLVLQYKALNLADNVISGFQKLTSIVSSALKKVYGVVKEVFESPFQILDDIKGKADSIVESIKQSFESLYNENDKFKNSVDALESDILLLKNAFEAAFAPLVQAAIPYMQRLAAAFTTVADLCGQFIAAAMGQKTYTKAVKQTVDVLKDEEKAEKMSLSSLDKLNNLSSEKVSEQSSTGLMFEEAPIDSYFSNFADKMKEQMFSPLKKAWDQEGKTVIDSWKNALLEVWNLMKEIGKDVLTMWNQEATVAMLANLLGIVGDIGMVVGNLAGRFREAWSTNEIGLHLLENIRNIFAIIIGHIRNAATNTVEWSKKLDFYPLLESVNGLLESLGPLVDNIGAGLEWFWNNILLPIAGWTIEDAIPIFFDLLSTAIGALNEVLEVLRPLGEWFWETFLQQIGQWAGELVINAMETMIELLTRFSEWISEHQELIEGFVIVIGSFFAAWEAVNLANTISTIVGAMIEMITTGQLLSSIMSIMGGAITFLTSPIGIITIAIGALIAIGVLLYKNWDQIKEKAGELSNWISEKWEAIKTTISNAVNNITETIGGTLNLLKCVWNEAWSNMKDTIKGIWEDIKGIINGILGRFEGMINGIIYGINFIIGALNGLSFEIPDWLKYIPGLSEFAGKTFGFNIPELSQIAMPRLATGTVIPPNREFMAVLGDNKREPEIVSPISTMKQAVLEAIAQTGKIGSEEITVKVPVSINEQVIFEIVKRLDREQFNRTGRPSFQI